MMMGSYNVNSMSDNPLWDFVYFTCVHTCIHCMVCPHLGKFNFNLSTKVDELLVGNLFFFVYEAVQAVTFSFQIVN